MSVFALTGELASGKTTALKHFSRKGAIVFSADSIIHGYYNNRQSKIYKKIVKLFPQAVVAGKINRKKIGNIVFADKEKLRQLENLIHPQVIIDLKLWIKKNNKNKRVLIAEVPLLFEKKLTRFFSAVILITVPRKIVIKRIQQKLKLSLSKINERLKLFLPQEDKIKNSDFILENKLTKADFKKNIDLVWGKLVNFSK